MNVAQGRESDRPAPTLGRPRVDRYDLIEDGLVVLGRHRIGKVGRQSSDMLSQGRHQR
jgi:hypothetical protein